MTENGFLVDTPNPERFPTFLKVASDCFRSASESSGTKLRKQRGWMPKLTKRAVDAIRPDPTGREIFVWDDALRGFGVRMMPSGAASYLVQYRTAEGRTRRLAIGKLGTLTPDEARIEARDKLAAAAKGADPSGQRHAARAAMTVAELCDLYIAEAKGRVKVSTLAMDRSRIERHVKPLLGRHSVRGLNPEDIEKMQLDIAAGKTARSAGGPRRRDHRRSGCRGAHRRDARHDPRTRPPAQADYRQPGARHSEATGRAAATVSDVDELGRLGATITRPKLTAPRTPLALQRSAFCC